MNLAATRIQPWVIALSSALYCTILCAVILTLLLRSGLAWKLALDQPNARSLHHRPTPRCGGWGIVPVVLVAMLWVRSSSAASWLWPLMVGVCILAIISYLDDRGGLSAGLRFLAHAATALLVLALTAGRLPVWSLVLVAFFWIWSINLYNFMDGADGLAGCMTLAGFGAYAIAARHNPALALTAGAVAGAALGFLFYNRPPARIFLGDVGSIPLGFLAAGLGYLGWQEEVWPVWFPCMVFAPFVLDATLTLCKRLLRGERVWEAHREHYYQRMIRSGLSHGRMTALWFVCMLIGSGYALLLLGCSESIQWLGVASWLMVLTGGAILIDRRWNRHQQPLQKDQEPA